jgi:hypothetical protein
MVKLLNKSPVLWKPSCHAMFSTTRHFNIFWASSPHSSPLYCFCHIYFNICLPFVVVPMLQLSTTLWRGIRGVEAQFHAFLTSALDGGEWSASRPGRFIPRERAPGTPWIGGCWVGVRAGQDAVVERYISSHYRDSNPDHPALSPALYRLHFSSI